jgi:hypothetical protein
MSIRVISPEGMAKFKSYTLYFTYSYIGEAVPLRRLRGNAVLDVNGFFYGLREPDGDDVTIAVIGGLNKHIYQNTDDPIIGFFITEFQKNSLRDLARAISVYGDTAEISSENRQLETMMTNMYRNFTG